jgi:hypothetical protein
MPGFPKRTAFRGSTDMTAQDSRTESDECGSPYRDAAEKNEEINS